MSLCNDLCLYILYMFFRTNVGTVKKELCDKDNNKYNSKDNNIDDIDSNKNKISIRKIYDNKLYLYNDTGLLIRKKIINTSKYYKTEHIFFTNDKDQKEEFKLYSNELRIYGKSDLTKLIINMKRDEDVKSEEEDINNATKISIINIAEAINIRKQESTK